MAGLLLDQKKISDYYNNMIQKKLLAGIFALVVIANVEAQETGVFAPFVSQIEVEARNNLIRLSWKDAYDVRGPVYVYRSHTPFTSLAALPVPAEVPYGTGSFLDEAEAPGSLYYFVVASDEWGRKYTLPILNTNFASISVKPENVPGWEARPGIPARGASSSSPSYVPSSIIEGINAQIEGSQVIISFSGADSAKNVILYRSLNPIRRQEDLLSALIIRQRVSSPIVDYPLPGITYYYALVYEEDLMGGIAGIRPGSNATSAVQVSTGARTGTRDLPLPELNISSSPVESAGFEKSAFTLDRRNERTAKRETEVFPEDLVNGGTGEEYQLRTIVQGYFLLKEWNKAEEEFRHFLELPRTAQNAARARFYLGQVYYFNKKPREALFEFLASREHYPDDSNSWIQAVLGDFARLP